ncbi:MAG: serine/threonine protein kinase [Acidobacteria bacterium]|nr:serine/threonine protein kinase [Acidobacteriota bacterium]MBI3423468.1 serine/threonine protein kinase [Acidobacteriota bacterium]
MHLEQWQQIDELFHAALERTPHARAAFLTNACQGQAGLQREIAKLLAAHEEPGAVWAVSAAHLAADWLSAQPAAPTLSGQQFGPYQIQSLLGKGGMGEVWRAHDTRLGRDVALKVLPAEFAQDADRLRRFEQEARAISALNHHNIITIHEIGQHDARHFIITELVDGVSLREHLHATRLPILEALDLTIQIASALAAAHQAGVVPRDIKPENVMLRPDGYVKVLDFGLAKLTGMRNADCGLRNEEADTLAKNPYSAIRNPHSAIDRSRPGNGDGVIYVARAGQRT